jgi:2-methylisocitrate lyase-like PEP mutase family enzyme
MTQKSKADLLRSLHSGPEVLVLPNAWDAVSARIVESEGFPAVATSSSGCAAVLGYADGQQIPRAEMMFLIAKIVRAVDVPVTADVEAGYDDPEQTALDVIAAGAAGLNFEDMIDDVLIPLDDQLRRLRALRAVADASGVPLVINARTDVFLARHGDAPTRFERSVERLNAYRAAGADCLFVPGVRDPETIGRLVNAIHGPVNILAQPGSPSIPDMKALGVARVSLGGGPSRVAAGAARRLVRNLRDHGTFEALGSEAIPSQDLQALLTRRS